MSYFKINFQKDTFIDCSKIFISTKRFLNYDSSIIKGYIGFYNDGRIIIGSAIETELPKTLTSKNSFDSSFCIGYYSTNNSKIRVEFFVPDGGGEYRIREGIVKKDTIIFSEIFFYPFREEIRRDTLIKSDYLLK